MAGGDRGSGRRAVHTFGHDGRFAFGYEGECANALVQPEALQSTQTWWFVRSHAAALTSLLNCHIFALWINFRVRQLLEIQRNKVLG
jgi:hypothetical protein